MNGAQHEIFPSGPAYGFIHPCYAWKFMCIYIIYLYLCTLIGLWGSFVHACSGIAYDWHSFRFVTNSYTRLFSGCFHPIYVLLFLWSVMDNAHCAPSDWDVSKTSSTLKDLETKIIEVLLYIYYFSRRLCVVLLSACLFWFDLFLVCAVPWKRCF